MASRKIFVIGFNKCGTSSLHYFFKNNNLKSLHWGGTDEKTNSACIIMRNFMLGRNILQGIEQYDAYSDLSFANNNIYIEGSRFYKQFYEQYPDALFILNTRDVGRWVKSRFNHHHGSLVKRSLNVYHCTEDELKALWEAQFLQHNAEVRKFFAETGGNFLEFNIESDPLEKLLEFLKPIGDFDPEHWIQANQTKAKPAAA